MNIMNIRLNSPLLLVDVIDAGAVVLAELGWDEYHEYSLEFAIIIG